jgi:uncharacterized coiled-coil DUF342 family protein
MFPRVSAIAAACLAVGAVLVGCDSDVRRADRQVQQDLTRGIELVRDGSPESVQQATQIFEQAASNQVISVATRANAKALLAQSELERARTTQQKIDGLQIELARLVWEANQLAQQISTTNALVAGYRKYDPAEAKTNIEKSIADATGGPERPAWFTHDKTTLPTLSAVRQEISRLEGEIATRQDKIKDVSAQRDRINDDANRASQQAQAGHSGSTLEAFTLASDLRKRAADLSTDLEVEQARLVPLQKDLAVAQAQQAVLEEVITQLQAQSAALDTGWKLVQEQIGAQAALARNILQGDAGAASASTQLSAAVGGSISAKAQEIERRIAELKSLRDQAIGDARNASSHYEETAMTANELRTQLSTKMEDPAFRDRPERKAWEQMRTAINPPAFQLQQSAAQRTLARLYASQAAEYDLRIMLRNSLGETLQVAGLALPPALQAANLERDRELAIKEASEAYAKANELLDNVAEGQRDESLAGAAQVARILTLYGWSQLERQANDQKSAEEHLQLAIQHRNSALEQNMRLPTMPAGLGAPPAPVAPESPATAPAGDAPATAPATPAAEPAAAPEP